MVLADVLLASVVPRVMVGLPTDNCDMSCSISQFLGQYQTLDFNRCFILIIPMCPSCANVNVCCRSTCGITILVPRRTSFPIRHNSLLTGIYFLHCILSHWFVVIHLPSSDSSSSSADALSISHVVIALGVAVTAKNFTNSSASF